MANVAYLSTVIVTLIWELFEIEDWREISKFTPHSGKQEAKNVKGRPKTTDYTILSSVKRWIWFLNGSFLKDFLLKHSASYVQCCLQQLIMSLCSKCPAAGLQWINKVMMLQTSVQYQRTDEVRGRIKYVSESCQSSYARELSFNVNQELLIAARSPSLKWPHAVINN